MPNAASSGLPNAASYTDLGNGAVLDNITCLVWQKAESPSDASSSGCSSASDAGAADDAGAPCGITEDIAYCDSLSASNAAGYSDWRVPTRVEIASIVDPTRTSSALNPIFTKEASGYDRTFSLWYETIAGIKNSTFGWVYNMGSGLTSNAYGQTSPAMVRCVRGNGTGETLMEQAVEPPNHYTIGSDGEVTDNYTGLIWQQVYSTTSMDWSAAAGYCSSLGLNGNTWRVPSLNELSTLVNEAVVSPAVNRTAFPNVVSCGTTTWFWAAEAYAGNSTYAWGINFCDGYTGYNVGQAHATDAGTTTYDWDYFQTGYARCVR
jgi:hypothetical protein